MPNTRLSRCAQVIAARRSAGVRALDAVSASDPAGTLAFLQVFWLASAASNNH